MFNKVSYLIMRHLEFLNLLCDVSRLTVLYAQQGDVERVSFESANRDKLINILIGFHDQISLLSKNTSIEYIRQFQLEDILKTWAHESDEKIKYIQALDLEILKLLNQEKQKTTADIQNIFVNRKKLSGYNLNNVK